MVCAAIRRDRFIQIMRFLHAAGNNKIIPTDKMWKYVLSNNFRKHFVSVPKLSFGESVITQCGPHGCKPCIREHPFALGIKCGT